MKGRIRQILSTSDRWKSDNAEYFFVSRKGCYNYFEKVSRICYHYICGCYIHASVHSCQKCIACSNDYIENSFTVKILMSALAAIFLEKSSGFGKSHQHHLLLLARLSPILSHHSSLWPIDSGWSSKLDPMSVQSCCRYHLFGRLTLERPC